jgi:prepilin-type processing-associated H-X9-DG protein/prepilin-type N-terminal cleavage/methylation domain-containing protein
MQDAAAGRAGRGRAAFTLVEVLVVATVLGILIALLMPGVRAVVEVARMTRCARNLSTIWQAHGLWRAENNVQHMIAGDDWTLRLLPYVEGRGEVFQCPSSRGRDLTSDRMAFCEMDIYKKDNRVPGGRLFLYTRPVFGYDPWVRREEIEPDKWLIRMEDENRQSDFVDIAMYLYFENNSPVKVDVLEGESWSTRTHIYEFKVHGEVIITDWVKHYGESFDIEVPEWPTADYGLSTGTYVTAAGPVFETDPKLFFILDYPKVVADYNGAGEEDEWDKYFIEDPEDWHDRYGQYEGAHTIWQAFQALRHFDQANVLFCDGHVEPLGIEDLHESNPLWRYRKN